MKTIRLQIICEYYYNVAKYYYTEATKVSRMFLNGQISYKRASREIVKLCGNVIWRGKICRDICAKYKIDFQIDNVSGIDLCDTICMLATSLTEWTKE